MLNKQLTVVQVESGVERVEMINYCFDEIYLGTKLRDESDSDVLKDIYDVLEGSKNAVWVPSTVQEIMNFIKQKCWKKVKRSRAQELRRRIMKTM
jgi:hypothetical protein